jgi:hypothetical protein
MMWTTPARASDSMKSCAKMVVVEQPSEKEKLWGERRGSGIIVAG